MGVGKMAQLLKYLLHKHENLNSIPNNLIKELNRASSSWDRQGGRGRRTFGICLAASLAKHSSFRFIERPGLKKMGKCDQGRPQ